MAIQIENLVLIGIAIHLLVFFMIIGKAVFSSKFRKEVIDLPLYVILLIGFFWPVAIIVIILLVLGLFPWVKKL